MENPTPANPERKGANIVALVCCGYLLINLLVAVLAPDTPAGELAEWAVLGPLLFLGLAILLPMALLLLLFLLYIVLTSLYITGPIFYLEFAQKLRRVGRPDQPADDSPATTAQLTVDDNRYLMSGYLLMMALFGLLPLLMPNVWPTERLVTAINQEEVAALHLKSTGLTSGVVAEWVDGARLNAFMVEYGPADDRQTAYVRSNAGNWLKARRALQDEGATLTATEVVGVPIATDALAIWLGYYLGRASLYLTVVNLLIVTLGVGWVVFHALLAVPAWLQSSDV